MSTHAQIHKVMPPQDRKSIRTFWTTLIGALALNAVIAFASIYVTQQKQEVFVSNQSDQIKEIKVDIRELKQDVKQILRDGRK